MGRTRQDLADLARDMTDLVKTLAVRGETVFGVDHLPPPPALPAPMAFGPEDPPTGGEAAQAVAAPPPSSIVHRPSSIEAHPSPVAHPPADLPRGLKDLARRADSCTRCGLAARRTKVVFGDGAGASGLMLIGEGPGRNEDETGIPFVGRAGKLLDRITAAVGFQRSELYITNIVKCRPPGNRDPRPEEVQSCRPYLNRQIEALGPKLVVAVGRPSAQSLLRTELPLTRLRGRVHAMGGIPVVVTYHPAYLLRSPAQKARAWEDWRRIRDLLARLRDGVAIPVDGEDVPL